MEQKSRKVVCRMRRKVSCQAASKECKWDETAEKCLPRAEDKEKPVVQNSKAINCGNRKKPACLTSPLHCKWDESINECRMIPPKKDAKVSPAPKKKTPVSSPKIKIQVKKVRAVNCGNRKKTTCFASPS